MHSILKQISQLAVFLALFGSFETGHAQNLISKRNALTVELLKDYQTNGETNLLNVLLGKAHDIGSKTDDDIINLYNARKSQLLEMISIAKSDAPVGFTLPSMDANCTEQGLPVCDTIEKFEDICAAESDGKCQVSTNLVSDIAPYFQGDLLSYYECLEDNSMDSSFCTDYSAVIGDYSGDYTLSSYSAVLLSDVFGQGTYGDDTVYFGSGGFTMNTDTVADYFASGKLYDPNWEGFNEKYATLDVITSSYVNYAYTHETTDETLLALYNVFLKGYFVETYGYRHDGFVHGLMKNNSIRFTRFSGELASEPCAYAIAVLATAFCGYTADDMYEWAEYYYTNYPDKCTDPALDKVYMRAKLALRMIFPNVRVKKSPAVCARRIKIV